MKRSVALSAALILSLAGAGGAALAQQKARPDCPSPSASAGSDARKTPSRIDGEVVKIDRSSKLVTLKASDGTTHQFRGDDSTLKDLKVGDKLELNLRTAGC